MILINPRTNATIKAEEIYGFHIEQFDNFEQYDFMRDNMNVLYIAKNKDGKVIYLHMIQFTSSQDKKSVRVDFEPANNFDTFKAVKMYRKYK